jgi:UDP-N-acetylglucosamine 4-epimerase
MYDKPLHQADISQRSFLITGGAGFIGSHIAEYLLAQGAAKVRVMDNFLTGHRRNIEPFMAHPAFEFMEGDISNPSDCAKACEGINYISHQAALGSVPRSVNDPQATNKYNIDGFLNMLVAARDAKVTRMVYASSSSVYGDAKELPKREGEEGMPLSPYAVTKKANELYARVFNDVYGFPLIGLRYFNIFGPRQDPDGPYAAVIPLFVKKSLNNETVWIDGDGEQTRDFTFVANAVKANVKALVDADSEAHGQVFNIAVGQSFSVNYLYKKITEGLGLEHKAEHREARKGDIRNSLADITQAQTYIGYKPEVSFEEGLPVTIEFFRKEFTGNQSN